MSYIGSKRHKLAVIEGGKRRAEQLLQMKTQNVDSYNKSPSICANCKEPIEYARRKNKFCSSSCAASVNNKGRVVSDTHKQKVSDKLKKPMVLVLRYCPTCNTSFECKTSSKKVYCNSKCYSITPEAKLKSSIGGKIGGKISASRQVRRSKNEILFAEKCKLKFGNVLENVPMFDGWDADVIIPSLKIAVLWNGNWHRKKLRDKHSVSQVQTRDKLKIQKIVEYGYTPYVVDDYGKHNPLFVEKEFEKFVKCL